MSLKGFLASGFQKLIGASRLKGANERFVGEYNVQEKTTTTVPFAETLNDGFNLIRYNASGDVSYTSGALFSSNPTTAAVVTIQNITPNRYLYFENVNATGGLVLSTNSAQIFGNQTITLMYNTTTSRWNEISRCTSEVSSKYVTLTTPVSNITLDNRGYNQTLYLNSTYSGAITLTQIYPPGFFGDGTGAILNIMVSPSLSEFNRIILQAGNGSLNYSFVMNGDFEFAKGGMITFVFDGLLWRENSRCNPIYS